jgi:hypothetical protein
MRGSKRTGENVWLLCAHGKLLLLLLLLLLVILTWTLHQYWTLHGTVWWPV